MDKEKLMKEFEEICGYTMRPYEFHVLNDVLAMLKEQEVVEPLLPLFNKRTKHFVCPNCSLVLDEMRDHYCPSCGKRIAWDEYEDEDGT